MYAPKLTVPLATRDASLALFGGKGQSLAKLAVAGLPVPAGFLLSTEAYMNFVETNGLQSSIQRIVGEATPHQSANIERASARIQSLFEEANLPDETATSIAQAYAELGEDEPSVAVRSSATAEDLPGLSFAGQQDTYLNVRGVAALTEAIRRCWASLWTPRAIAYREQMRIDQRVVAMGVVVQLMVDADVSGILFTANPSSGDRSELVVNASFGLGEAVVGGDVTPDTFVLDKTSFETKETLIGDKDKMTVSLGQQGTITQPVPEDQRNERSISAEVLRELASLSMKVETLFDGLPQDIEWAASHGRCWLLQSRPITNLPAPPLRDVSWDPPSKGAKLIRRQVVENMPDPLSPLFEELYLEDGLDHSVDILFTELGIPFSVAEFAEVIERPMFLTVNGYAYCRASYRFSWRLAYLVPRILYWYATSFRKLAREMIPNWRDKGLPGYLGTIEEWKTVNAVTASDEQLLTGVRALTVADATYWFYVSGVIALAKMTDGMLQRFLASWAVKGNLTSGLFLSGFPSKTLQAQEELEAIANRVHTFESLREVVATQPAEKVLEALAHHSDGQSVLHEIELYLRQYGHLIYNLDFVQPPQAENPLPVLLSLKALVESDGYDTPARQADMARTRESRIKETSDSLGPIRRWLFRKLLGWAQTFGPYREEALFYMGAAWPTLRGLALELGKRLVEAGTFTIPDDVFYLTSAELADAAAARHDGLVRPDLRQEVVCRRELRESRKRLHPPGMVPEGSRFKVGPFDFSYFETQKRNTDDSATLKGFAVSPGKVTGRATVILSPADFAEMKPDTILVCPTTTPAWTPLFAQASGLVTDIGAILAHGSIVAREYGIPAVMGTGNATQRVVSGQQITVDGDVGTVTLLENTRE